MTTTTRGTRVLVPYHLDEHRPDLDVPFVPDATITAELPDAGVWERMTVLYERVARMVAESTGAGVTVASGDCTASLGTVAGLQRRGLDPTIVWFDAHGDVQTVETSTSGYLGGMPVRILTGYRPELISARLGLRPVPEDKIVLVDVRDLDPPERTYLDGSAVRRRGVPDLRAEDVPDGPVYLHLDLDVVDEVELPGLLFPASGGPTMAAVGRAVSQVLATGRVVAVGLGCTWHPGAGAADRVRAGLGAELGLG